jgi:hypothetical protein
MAMILLAACLAAAPGHVTVAPAEDAQALLHNPDMGWVLYENYPVDQRPGGSSTMVTMPDERFDGVDHVAVMFAWSDVEREPDRYDFSDVDRAYDHWHKRGKSIQLRMSAESLLWWNNATPPGGRARAAVPAGSPARRRETGAELRGVGVRRRRRARSDIPRSAGEVPPRRRQPLRR